MTWGPFSAEATQLFSKLQALKDGDPVVGIMTIEAALQQAHIAGPSNISYEEFERQNDSVDCQMAAQGSSTPVSLSHDAADMVERVARAVTSRLFHSSLDEDWVANVDIAEAALEASCYAELVRLLKETRWYVRDSLIKRIEALLEKIGEL